MKKILIIYATSGFGHMKAALAIKGAFEEIRPRNTEIKIIDSLDYTNPFFKKFYPSAYSFLVTHLPAIWGFFYYLLDNRFVYYAILPFKNIIERLNTIKLRRFVLEYKPDVIVSTQFLASSAISRIRNKIPNTRLITVITDYLPHSYWLSKSDILVVASEESKGYLTERGIGRNKIKILGIPVLTKFTKKGDRGSLQKKFGLKKNIFTIFLSGGGFGMGPIIKMLDILNNVESKIQVIVLCGNNKNLYGAVMAMKSRLKFPLLALHFVDNVYDYMQVSDLLITKAGGIITTEALAKELPMLLVASIPGQEARNANHLERNGAAIKIKNLNETRAIIDYFAVNPKALAKLRKNTRRIRRPNASYDIARLSVSMPSH